GGGSGSEDRQQPRPPEAGPGHGHEECPWHIAPGERRVEEKQQEGQGDRAPNGPFLVRPTQRQPDGWFVRVHLEPRGCSRTHSHAETSSTTLPRVCTAIWSLISRLRRGP